MIHKGPAVGMEGPPVDCVEQSPACTWGLRIPNGAVELLKQLQCLCSAVVDSMPAVWLASGCLHLCSL